MYNYYIMAYDLKTRKNIYRWRETHRDAYNSYMSKISNDYYMKHKAECNARRVKNARFNRESKRLRNILID